MIEIKYSKIKKVVLKEVKIKKIFQSILKKNLDESEKIMISESNMSDRTLFLSMINGIFKRFF